MTGSDALMGFLGSDNGHTEDPQVSFLRNDILGNGFEIVRMNFPPQNLELGAHLRIYLTIGAKGTVPQQQPMDWTPELEEFLFKQGVQASNPDEEANRGAHILLRNLQSAEEVWGRGGYVNVVLHRLISESFGEVPPIKTLLGKIRTNHVDDRSSYYADCYAYLKNSLHGYGNSLQMELRYNSEVAAGVFLLALARTVDKHFRITERDELFGR